MSYLSRFKLNSPSVVHELIDGEVIIINLEKGYYYSLTKVGTYVWAAIIAGYKQSDISEELELFFKEESDKISNSINNLITELLTEKIIIPTAGENGNNNPTTKISIPENLKFSEPGLAKYTDMEDLLLLDPIHDVDERGWPNSKL